MFAKTLLALFAGAVAVSAAPAEKRSAYFADIDQGKTISGGRATFYNTEKNDGYCGWFNRNSEHVVAMNRPQFEPENMCGNYVEINNSENGNKIVAQIVDECPECQYGSLDLSRGLFADLVGDNWEDKGVADITYQFLPTDYKPSDN